MRLSGPYRPALVFKVVLAGGLRWTVAPIEREMRIGTSRAGVLLGEFPMEPTPESSGLRRERLVAICVLMLFTAFAVWALTTGWRSRALMGNGFRQTQTAMTALFVQRDHDFSLAYPTPVLGKPWSVPFEFPLYQWTVVAVSDATGLSLFKSGRLVSMICFGLCLPAIWLLLGRMGLPWVRRAMAMGLVLTCPLLLFYARAFLIETMALLFALWFLLAFVAAVERRSVGWLVVANLAGVGAGLVKVTTFMVYLVPAVLWGVWWLWRERPMDNASRRWAGVGRVCGWSAAAVTVPFAATCWWVAYTDRLRALNPGARGLVSSALYSYNFGTWADRLNPKVWGAHLRVVTEEVVATPVLLVLALLLVLFPRGRYLYWVLGCAALFVLAPVVFPVLYAWHEYYFTAVAVLPMIAGGLIIARAGDNGIPAWRLWAVLVACCALQAGRWMTFHRPLQSEDIPGASELAEALRWSTDSNDVLVIAGEDWAAVTPFYAQRRALMLRRDMESDWPYVRESFEKLAGEHVAALVLRGAQRDNRVLLEMASAQFGIAQQPTYRWRDVLVFVREEKAAQVAATVAQLQLEEIEVLRGRTLADSPSETIWEQRYFSAKQRLAFANLGMLPTRYTSQFGVGPSAMDGRACLGAHPTTRLWFGAPTGARVLRIEFGLPKETYEGLDRMTASDGVEFVVAAVRGDSRRVLFSRLLDPFASPEDRGWQSAEVRLALQPGEELLLETNPGPEGNLNRDWAVLGPMKFD